MKKRNPDIDDYFSYRHYQYLSDNYLYSLKRDPETISEIIYENFGETEIFIFEEYLVKKRSLKTIALDLGFSYSYTRQILFRSREKLNLILNTYK